MRRTGAKNLDQPDCTNPTNFFGRGGGGCKNTRLVTKNSAASFGDFWVSPFSASAMQSCMRSSWLAIPMLTHSSVLSAFPAVV